MNLNWSFNLNENAANPSFPCRFILKSLSIYAQSVARTYICNDDLTFPAYGFIVALELNIYVIKSNIMLFTAFYAQYV